TASDRLGASTTPGAVFGLSALWARRARRPGPLLACPSVTTGADPRPRRPGRSVPPGPQHPRARQLDPPSRGRGTARPSPPAALCPADGGAAILDARGP